MYDQEGGPDAIDEQEELPTGVVTMLTRCYSPSCGGGRGGRGPCYAFSCPRKVCHNLCRLYQTNIMISHKGQLMIRPLSVQVETPAEVTEWEAMVGRAVVDSLPRSEVIRQKSVMF